MDLAGYLAVLRRRLVPLLLCLLVGVGGGYYRGHHTAATYQATSKAIVSLPQSAANPESGLAGAQLSAQFVTTYAAIATSRSVAEKVVAALQLPDSVESVQGRLSAGVEPTTYIIDITASDGDPAFAKSLADTAAVALGERVKELEAGKTSRVQAQLLDRAAVPAVPTSPKPRTDVLLGLILGLLTGFVLIVVLEALDRTIKTTEQGDAAFDAPLLALIPRRRGHGGLVLSGDASDLDGEPYRTLRTAVQFADPDVALRTILVTSTSPGDGKTTTVANLALALAASGQHVVVVDADLRRAALAAVFGLEGAVGLSSLVLRNLPIDEVLQQWSDRVTVLPSGRPLPPNPSELLGSDFMSQIIQELAGRFDVVLIDTPPILPVTDAVALATQVDAVLLVARHGVTHRGPAAEARRRLDAVGAHVIGYVLNAVPSRESAGYYADYRIDAGGRGKRPMNLARHDVPAG